MYLIDQKGSFVKYVCHEVRSSLSIVHAGLEILLEEFAGKESNDESSLCRDLVDDCFVGSTAAINILNDLLQVFRLNNIKKYLSLHNSYILRYRSMKISTRIH